MFFIIKFLEARGERARAEQLLVELLTVIVETNYQQQGPTFPSPYLGAEEILAASVPDRLQDANFEGYRGSSFILKSILEMLVRRGRCDVVAAKWRQLTYCELHEFAPDRVEDVFAWRTPDGTNVSGFANQTQSWAALVAACNDLSAVPTLHGELRQVLAFHILVCPHRATPLVIRSLDVMR